MHGVILHAEAKYPTDPPTGLIKRRENGLTLVELIVTIAVLVISITWAIPRYQQFTARNEVAAEVMRLMTALALARNTAVTRRTIVTLCPTVDMSQCHINDNDDGEAWLSTLVVFEGRGEPGDELLRNFGESRLQSLTYRDDDRPVRYKMLGLPTGYNGTFEICGRHGEGATVIVSNFGRTRVGEKSSACQTL